MKYLLVSGIYPPDIGGPATYIPTLAKRLSSLGNSAEVISLSNEKSGQVEELEWTITFVSRKLPKILRVPKTAVLIRQILKRNDSIFVNGLYTESALAIYLSGKASVAKVVGDPVWERYRNRHITDIEIDDFDNKWHGLSCYLQRKVFTWSLNRFSIVTCPGEGLASLLAQWGIKPPIVVVENGVQCLPLQERTEKYDVVSLTRLVKWKRIDLLIQACAMSGLHLAIAGEGPERESLEILAKTLHANVDFLGQISQEHVPDFLSSAPIFALLSSYEGLSFSLIQAMMMGSRILVSDARGNSDVIEDGISGIIVRNPSADVIASELKALREDSVRNRNLQEQARKIAIQRYCEESQLDKMAALFSRIEP
jgi:glycosyltransferase involved in cell wall biosynthesis